MSKVLPGNYANPLVPGIDTLQMMPGVVQDFIEEEIALSPAAASFPLSRQLPAGAVILLAQLKIPATISATTATKIGLGIAADPDKYVLSAALTAQDAGGLRNLAVDAVPLAAAETVGVYAVDNAGAAAGTIGGTGQKVKVRIVFLKPENIA